jgi:ATP-dependent helicase HrpA
VDAGGDVDIRVFATTAEQDAAIGPGIRRLLRLSVASPVKTIERQLNPRTRLVLGANPDGSLPALLDDCADAAVTVLAPAPVWSHSEFAALRQRVADTLAPATLDVVGRVEKALAAAHEVQVALPAAPPPTQADAIADIRAQLDRLLPQGFVTSTGAAHLGDLARYLTAVGRRLERLPQGVNADHDRMVRVQAVQDAYDELRQALSPARAAADDVRDIARMIEELRVSLWAQQLGTARSVSEQRIYRAIDAVTP